MNLDCNFKLPKQSQYQRLMSAAAPNKQLVDTRSLLLTLFTSFLRIVKAILSRFKQAHLAFPPGGRKSGSTTNILISEFAIYGIFMYFLLMYFFYLYLSIYLLVFMGFCLK